MSYFVRIFGRSTQPITRREITEFISAGAFFEHNPRFEPEADSAEGAEERWSALTVHYDPDKRPIRLERNVADKLVEEEVGELVYILDRSKKTPAQQKILKTLQATTQVISIEINRETVSEDCWEMLDSVESFLAERCDGIVFAPEDGLFDSGLRRIYRL